MRHRERFRPSELSDGTFLIGLGGRDLIATGDSVTTRSTAETPSPAPSVIPQQCVPPSCIAAQTGPSLPLSPKLRNLRGPSLFPGKPYPGTVLALLQGTPRTRFGAGGVPLLGLELPKTVGRGLLFMR